MTQNLVGPPVLGKFDYAARQVAVELLQLRFESREERESVGGGPGESSQDFVVIESPQLPRGCFEDFVTERDLAVTRHHDFTVAANADHRSRANSLFHGVETQF